MVIHMYTVKRCLGEFVSESLHFAFLLLLHILTSFTFCTMHGIILILLLVLSCMHAVHKQLAANTETSESYCNTLIGFHTALGLVD